MKATHHRMPVVVPVGYEEKWIKQVKDAHELKSLQLDTRSWSPNGWVIEKVDKKPIDQMSLF